VFALVWGIILTGGALLFPENQKTPVVVISLSIASFTYGALLGAFFLGIFWRRAIQRDAILGMSVGIVVMSLIVFAKQIIAAVPSMASLLGPPISTIAYPWFVLIGTAITFGVGALSSYTHSAPVDVPVGVART
jgi:SSS family solute:Na+ symporter